MELARENRGRDRPVVATKTLAIKKTWEYPMTCWQFNKPHFFYVELLKPP